MICINTFNDKCRLIYMIAAEASGWLHIQIVDYVVSTLFNRNAFSYQRPKHILTHGFERANGLQATTRNDTLACSLRGIVARFPNKNVQSLKRAPWTDILGLLGSSGEDIMTSLLFDCGVFTAIDCRKGIYYQLSGKPCHSRPSEWLLMLEYRYSAIRSWTNE